MPRLSPLRFLVFGLLFAAIGVAILAVSRADSPAILPTAANAKDALGVSTPGSFTNYEKWVGRDLKYEMRIHKKLALKGQPSATAIASFKQNQLVGNQGTFYTIKQTIAGRAANKPKVTSVVTIGMVPEDLDNAQKMCGDVKCNVSNLNRGLNGEWDAYYLALAQDIVEEGLNTKYPDGRPKIILRLGHEHNGTWYGWSSVGAQDKYAALWRRAYNIMKPVIGPNVLWEWNLSAGPGLGAAASAYPGNEYVDIIGIDFYDRGYNDPERFTCPYTSCPPFPLPSHTRDQEEVAWGRVQSKMDAIFAFAVTKGKMVGLSEWGASAKKATNDLWVAGGNSPYFMQQTYNWINARTASGSVASNRRIGYAIYFERNGEGKELGGVKGHQKLSPGDDNTEVPNQTGVLQFSYGDGVESTDFPNKGTALGLTATYLQLFGGGSSTNTPPTVSAGDDRTVSRVATITHEGSASDDGRPNPLTTTWSKVSGSGTVTFGSPNNTTTTIVFPATGTYVLRLTATDGQYTVSDDVTFTVNDDANPQYDLVVTNVFFEGTTISSGQEVVFKATIKNQGQAATPAGIIHGVGFHINGVQVTWSDTHTASIAPGSSVTLTANGGPDGSDTWEAIAGKYNLMPC